MSERYLPDIIDQVLDVIPDDQDEVIKDLKNLRYSALYTAPEIMGKLWQSCAVILGSRLGACDTDWKKRVSAIMKGQEKDGQ